MKYNDKIAKVIRKIRLSQKLSQKQFGEQVLNTSKRNVIRLEQGISKISLEEFLNMNDYFELDKFETLQQVVENKQYTEVINGVQTLLKNPMCNFEQVEQLLNQLYEESSFQLLSDYEKQKLEFIHAFVMAKQADNLEILRYAFSKNQYYLLEQLYISNWFIPFLSNEEILFLLDGITESFIKNVANKKIDLVVSLLLNSLGFLIDKEFNDFDCLADKITLTKDLIVQYNLYHLLPLFYRHVAIIASLNNDQAEYVLYRDKALTLAELFENKRMFKYLKADFEEYKK